MAIHFYLKNGEYGEFSNFSNHPIEINGRVYPTVEHFYQAMKFRDFEYAEKIRRASSPMEAKRLGRTRKLTVRDDWEQNKVDVMRQAIREKFRLNTQLRDILLSTGDEELIEAAPYDEFWGSGRTGEGQNWLGRILMEVRSELHSAK
jgi:N-glycosidase YbiA